MALTSGRSTMDNVVGIGIDHQGDAAMFDPDPEKTSLVRSMLKLMIFGLHIWICLIKDAMLRKARTDAPGALHHIICAI
jgi:hypothetical protein